MPATPAFFYFDLGNVLLSFSHERMCEQMAAVAGVSAELVRRALFEAPASDRSIQWRFERGDLNVLAVYDHFCETLGVEPNRDELFAAGRDIFTEIGDSIAIVGELAAAGRRSIRGLDLAAGATGDHLAGIGGFAQDLADLVERHREHVVQHEGEPLGGTERVEHHE